jgi:hypothetical protein
VYLICSDYVTQLTQNYIKAVKTDTLLASYITVPQREKNLI